MPRLDKTLKKVLASPFEKWWTKPVIVDEENNVNLTRETIVLGVSRAHIGVVDSNSTGAYQAIAQRAKLPEVTVPDVMPKMIELEYASVRQIAFEMLETLFAGYGEHLRVH